MMPDRFPTSVPQILPRLALYQMLSVCLHVIILLLLIGGVGCHVVDTTSEDLTQKKLLSPVQPGMDAVQLDIVYVERDEKDPLLTKILWDEVDQIGTIDLKTRSRLRDSGFRVGLVGMTPPRSLQRLLGFCMDITDNASTSRHKELVGRSVMLRSGSETQIQTSESHSEISVKFPDASEPTLLTNARFMFRAQLERLQDGWVKLHLTPEIHHGSSKLRPVAGAVDWSLTGAQEVKSFDDLKFSVMLNVGEMVILSADQLQDEAIADLFFVNRNVQRPQRRMVVIRLSDMKKLEPLYTE